MNSEHLISKKEIIYYPCHDFSLKLNSNSHITNSRFFSPSNQSITFDPITPWDVFWAKAKKAQLVDSYCNIIQSTFENYPIDELNDAEIQNIIDILEKPMKGKFEINYTLKEYFQYLIAMSIEKLNISINSIYLVGGILPSLLKNYYIRNINHVYKEQCRLLNLEYIGELISEELAADLDRIAPDTDIVSTIDSGDLGLLVNLNTRFFSDKLQTEHENFGQKDQIIKNNFYLDLLSKPESEFTFVKLASGDHIVDSTFMHKKNANRCLFSHHGMKLNIMPLILKLNREIKNDPSNFKELKLTPNNELSSCWGAMFARVGKKIICQDINERAWAAYISNKSIGYSISDPNIEAILFNKMCASKLNLN
ncbi:MAG: hypothetical protein H0U27_07830, partial [Nitrosopumilus sp.]|nr:hypothetical protein [Nitrosopumilus sp.]